ncbi:MAG: DUF1450 domain-containing protein [Candidatus Carbobacillus altaicus]|uniref:UDP-N-acetylmuramoylalanine--D-glutamate ligase n=1 Tax=Candidatus Carbonibacillus altaicus TaxID=2163959 RepID=A0A2R6Y4Q9_9BACL|nr:DUF1450 domain-containing protein [Candidatus Carbobacillus altaicus]PTQ57633.1 MAG: hypothetical protein BSOLF_1177 [Candidatus Carbobacillus altaicus]
MDEEGGTVYGIVEFCVSNIASLSQKTYERLLERPDIDVIEYGCLSHCSECFLHPYALVNGTYVEADEDEMLYARIIEKLAEDEALDG